MYVLIDDKVVCLGESARLDWLTDGIFFNPEMLCLELHELVAQKWAEILQTVFLISNEDFVLQQLDYALLMLPGLTGDCVRIKGLVQCKLEALVDKHHYALFKKQVKVITQNKKLERAHRKCQASDPDACHICGGADYWVHDCSKKGDVAVHGSLTGMTFTGGKEHPIMGRLHDAQWSWQWATWGDSEMQTRDEVSSLWAMWAVSVYNTTMVAKYGYPCMIAPLHMEEQAGKLRLCFDSCYTNKCNGLGKVHFSLLDDIRRTMLKHKLFSKIDVCSGYHHLAVPEADAPWLCFMLDGVIYYWHCIMFGMCLASHWFTRMTMVIVTILQVVLGCPLIVYINDFVLFLGDDLGHVQQHWKAPRMIKNYVVSMRFFEHWYETKMGPLTVKLLKHFFVDCFDGGVRYETTINPVHSWLCLCDHVLSITREQSMAAHQCIKELLWGYHNISLAQHFTHTWPITLDVNGHLKAVLG
eukprot:m51a1_g12028 hypothetical protein (470) ;mRNA; f:2123-5863